MSLVTTIIPTFNRAHLLGRALGSALGQVGADVEVVVVDDGSSDQTESVVAAVRDSRVRYIRHDANKGLPGARNTGIRAARGELIAFLDDDDEWLPRKLQRQLSVMDRADACFTAVIFDNGSIKRFPRDRVGLDDLRRGNSFDPSSLLVKTAILRQVMFDESLRIGEDWDAFIRLAERCCVGYLNEPLTIYHLGAQTMTAESRNLSIDALHGRMSMLHKHREFFGPFWYRYHVADHLLSYFWQRTGKWNHLRKVVDCCGTLPVMAVLQSKVTRHARYLAQRRCT